MTIQAALFSPAPDEAVAYALNGLDPTRMRRVVAELGTKVLYVRVDGALVRFVVLAIKLLANLCARAHLTGMAYKVGKHLGFLVGKAEFFSVELKGTVWLSGLETVGARLVPCNLHRVIGLLRVWTRAGTHDSICHASRNLVHDYPPPPQGNLR